MARASWDSDRDGRHHLWILPSSGGALTQLTAGPAPDLHPKFSPDGKEIVFYSWRSGDRDIYIMPAGGGTARLLSPSPGHDIQPSWSPDGEEITFTSNRGGNNDIWVVSSRGGEARRLTDTDALDQASQWSPDGELLTFESWREGSLQVWAVPAGGGDPKKLTDRGGRAMAWSPDGTTLYTVAFGVPGVLARSMESGTESVVTDLSGRAGVFGESIDTDGEYLYFTWVEESGDIWVMDVDRGASD